MNRDDFYELFFKFVLICFFTAFTIQYAAVFDIIIVDITRYSRLLEASVIGAFAIYGALRKEVSAFWGIIAFAVLSAYHVIFTINSGIPANFNTLFGWIPLIAFVPIALLRTPFETQAKLLYFVSLGYTLTYVVLTKWLIAASQATVNAGGVLNSGDARGDRVFLAGLSASFVLFYSFEARKLLVVLRLGAATLAIAAIVLSGSRMFTVLALLVLAIAVLRLNRRWVMISLSALFLIISSIHLFGVIDRTWNPYGFIEGDKSALGRYIEYPIAVGTIKDHPLLGVGIEPDSDAMAQYLGLPKRLGTVYWNDLAAIAPLGQFGIPGLLLFLIASVLCLLSGAKRSRDPGLNALRLNCVLSALYGIEAPTILWPAASFFTAMLFGVWFRKRRLARLLRAAKPAPVSRAQEWAVA